MADEIILKTFEAHSVTGDTIILKNENDLSKLYNLIKAGNEDFIVSWKEKGMISKAKKKSKILSAKKIKPSLENGQLKIWSEAAGI